LKSYNFENSFTINTFGFGKDHDAQLMSDISDLRDGNFYYIEKLEMVEDSFVDALGGLFSVIAEKVNIQLNLNNSHEFLKNVQISKTFGEMWKENKKN